MFFNTNSKIIQIEKNKQKVRYIDLFAGMGGLRLGFEQGFKDKGFETECVMTSEIKPYAIDILNHNFNHNLMVGDITQVKEEDIPEFDVLLGGFPCQAFSTAGNRLGFEDTRGTLFFEVARIIKAKKPYAFILENVEGLVTHDLEEKTDKVGKTLKVILKTLEDLGYIVSWEVLDAKNFRVAQSRKRIFIVGTLDDKINLKNFPRKNVKLSDILEKGKDTIDSNFTRCLLSHFTEEELYGKAIKDKRGGKNNIHSWDIELKGSVSKEQKELLEELLKQRRYKKWAEEIGIKWMDGMPLTLNQISTFYQHDNLKEMLDDLVLKGYIKLEHPKEEVEVIGKNGKAKKERQYDESKPKGYNIVTGKLSFEFSKILDPNDITPTLVATDVSKLGVIDNKGIRTLTLREGLRLFGFPESYSLDILNEENKSINKGFDLLGNTVVVSVVREVAKRIAEKY
ncbi:MAG: DNA (cytosine-5-)-methyltransferase [Clostridia bacterium]